MSADIRCQFCNRKITNLKYLQIQAGPICARRHGLLFLAIKDQKSPPVAAARSEVISLSPEKQTEQLISQLIKDSPFKGRVFSVGGFVRDDLLGLKSKDLDLVVSEDGGSANLGSFIHSSFSDETSQAYQMGESYPIWRLAFKKDITFNGTEYRTAGVEIDIADTQKESFPDTGSRQRVSIFGTIDEDVQRRDFTCNMLLRDLTTGELLDKTGTSIHDIKNGILRGHPDISLTKIFSDDPLRMIRLIRFQAKYNWKVPFHVIKSVKENAHRLDIVSMERIREELFKMIDTGRFHKSLKFMKVTNVLKSILPEIDRLDKQKFKKALFLTQKAKPDVVDQVSALLHGIEPTEFIKDKKSVTNLILKKLKLETTTAIEVKKILELQPQVVTFDKEPSIQKLRSYLRECGPELSHILDLAEASLLFSNPGKPTFISELKQKIDKTLLIPIRTKPILNGEEVMDLLKVTPGPVMTKINSFLIKLDDEFAAENKILTKEDAILSLVKRKDF
jgi:poly(A) polymerase